MPIDNEFENSCMKERIKKFEPYVIILNTPVEIKRATGRYNRGSKYFLKGAEILAESETPLLSIILGYFALEHKANEILAFKGYKIKDHVCIIKAISKILERSDLAKELANAYNERLNANYIMSFSTIENDKEYAKRFLEKVKKFIEEMEKIK